MRLPGTVRGVHQIGPEPEPRAAPGTWNRQPKTSAHSRAPGTRLSPMMGPNRPGDRGRRCPGCHRDAPGPRGWKIYFSGVSPPCVPRPTLPRGCPESRPAFQPAPDTCRSGSGPPVRESGENDPFPAPKAGNPEKVSSAIYLPKLNQQRAEMRGSRGKAFLTV